MTTWLADQLPAYLVEDRFFGQLIALFTALAGETRVHSDSLPYLADLDVTSDQMLRYMGRWLGFDLIDPALPDHRQRQLVGRLGSIVSWRGTRRGLVELLTLFTEDAVEVTVSTDLPRRAGLGKGPAGGGTGRLPATSAGGAGVKVVTVRVVNTAWLTPEQFTELVRDEIPADCTLVLYLNDRELTSRQPAPQRR